MNPVHPLVFIDKTNDLFTPKDSSHKELKY